MRAFAAEAGDAHAAAFYEAPEFWVLVAFVLLIAGAFRPLFRTVTGALDRRAETIRSQIDEARRLREEAQDLLASYQRRHRGAVAEAAEIADRARADAARLAARAEEDLERALKRREQLAVERIAHAEAKALEAVRGLAVDLALDATRRVLAEKVTGKKAAALIDVAIKELPKKLH